MSHTMIDTVHLTAHNIPLKTPYVAGYVTGSSGVQWTQADWDRFETGTLRRVRINQSANPGSVTADYDVIDSEPGAASAAATAKAARTRQDGGRGTAVYVDLDGSDEMATALDAAGCHPAHVHLWLADYDLDHAEAVAKLGTRIGGYMIRAVQWASPSSNPNTLVPGSGLTLKAANVDLSVVQDGWMVPAQKPDKIVVTFTSTDGGKTYKRS